MDEQSLINAIKGSVQDLRAFLRTNQIESEQFRNLSVLSAIFEAYSHEKIDLMRRDVGLRVEDLFYGAIAYGNMAAFNKLREDYPRVDIDNVRGADGRPIIFFATVRAQDDEGYKENFLPLLLKSGIDVNAVDANGVTPIMYAGAMSSPVCRPVWNLDILDQLKEAGADINCSRDDASVLELAVLAKREDDALWFLKQNCEVPVESSRQFLEFAMKKDSSVTILKEFLHRGVDPNSLFDWHESVISKITRLPKVVEKVTILKEAQEVWRYAAQEGVAQDPKVKAVCKAFASSGGIAKNIADLTPEALMHVVSQGARPVHVPTRSCWSGLFCKTPVVVDSFASDRYKASSAFSDLYGGEDSQRLNKLLEAARNISAVRATSRTLRHYAEGGTLQGCPEKAGARGLEALPGLPLDRVMQFLTGASAVDRKSLFCDGVEELDAPVSVHVSAATGRGLDVGPEEGGRWAIRVIQDNGADLEIGG
jgi:hypothetical protein